jgi:hypothetical protein
MRRERSANRCESGACGTSAARPTARSTSRASSQVGWLAVTPSSAAPRRSVRTRTASRGASAYRAASGPGSTGSPTSTSTREPNRSLAS